MIGLTTYREEATWGVWREHLADVLHAEYADQVAAVGGVPLLLPPASAEHEVAASVVSRLDGLVVSGGADVDPARYGETAHERTTGWRPDRDAWEIGLLEAAAVARIPVLGICRGMQVMAVAAGGSLDQHVPDLVDHDRHSPGGAAFGDVQVDLVPGSRTSALLGVTVDVRCHHHQAVRAAPGFVVSAWADDGTVEAIEQPGERFCLGVQWHPEMAEELALLAGLVAAARAPHDA